MRLQKGKTKTKSIQESWLENTISFLHLSCVSILHHSHKKRKDNLEARAVLLIFPLNLKCLGWLYRAYIKRTKNGAFREEVFSENDFEAVLVTSCCYDHGVRASEALQKIDADQKEYRKCSLCVIICYIVINSHNTPINQQ